MTDLNSLVIFVRVVEAKSFSEAARRLAMPISTVSRRIADLEDQLGVRLLERSTRSLKLTEIGGEIYEHAQRGAELSEAVGNIVTQQLAEVSGTLKLSAPPSLSENLLAPLAAGFQSSYPRVRIQVLITDRLVDHIAEGVDLAFRVGALKDSSLVAKRILNYRHQIVASAEYLKKCKKIKRPRDLLEHRLLAFSFWQPETAWEFTHNETGEKELVTFSPYLAINDYAGLATAVLGGLGISDLPPICQPELIQSGRLIEVLPMWRLKACDLSLVHLSNRHMARPVRLFKEFTAQMAPALFPSLPS